MQRVHWPEYGDVRVFRRCFAQYAAGAILVASALAAAATLVAPGTVLVALPLCAGLLMAGTIAAHQHARHQGWIAEITRSFGRLMVLRDGHAVRLDARPVRSRHRSRYQAVRAAMDLGGWVVIIQAYGAWFVLTGTDARQSPAPVALRNMAVADIVPATTLAGRIRTA